jgi:hypothetical protein
MEFAIPGVALGLLYVVTNQSKNKNKENFSGRSQLPNVDIPNRNYPNELPILSPDIDQTSQLSTTNRFDNGGGVYTDKYFNSNKNISTNPNELSYYNLTGDLVNESYFEHNNMVPFFGSHLRSQIVGSTVNEGLLDNYSGAGSQYITKKEQSPLFKPDENLQCAYGAPNSSDFYQSRVNPSMRMANVKPFAEETVGPGLGLGYTTEGSGGFNSGMMMRDKWLDKTVDELRVNNNPKASGYSLLGHEGPANSFIKSMATQDQMGVVEKNRPERAFEIFNNDKNYLMTTTGLQKGPTMRAIPIEKHVSRPETAISYSGIAGAHNSSSYIPGEYMPSHNQQLGELPFGVANAQGRNYANDGEFEIKAKMAYPNNRSSNNQDAYFGLVSGSLGAAVAPLLDMLRPSRKENVIGTLRPYQNPGTTVPQSYIFNPADRPATTIRETTENSKNHLNVNGFTKGAYQVTDHQVSDTYRAETGDFYYAGVAGAGAGTRQMKSYESGYNQRNNDIKSSTINGYMVQGNMSLMNGDITARQANRDGMLKNNRAVAGTMPYQSPHVMNMGNLAGGSGSNLYSNIQLDRNSGDILTSLKSNPYVVNFNV